MTNYEKYLAEKLKDPKIKKEYDALEPEFTLIRAMLDAREKTGISQKELSAKTGIAQSEISKFENGNGNPSFRTLRRLAEGMGMRLRIEFDPAPAN